jgi:hypothetical protein
VYTLASLVLTFEGGPGLTMRTARRTVIEQEACNRKNAEFTPYLKNEILSIVECDQVREKRP